MRKKLLDEIIGWYGVLAILTAYGLINFNILTSTNLIYQFLNLTGALAIVYISFKKKAYQPAILNIIWVLIAVVAIIRSLR